MPEIATATIPKADIIFGETILSQIIAASDDGIIVNFRDKTGLIERMVKGKCE